MFVERKEGDDERTWSQQRKMSERERGGCEREDVDNLLKG